MLAVTHFAEETQIFLHGAITIRRVAARFVQSAAIGLHFFSRLFVHIGVTGLDQVLGKFVHVFKVRAREVEVRFLFVHPVKAQPTDAVENAVDILLIFLHWIGVVKAHVAIATVVAGKTKVQADALGVTNVQIAVRFRRETRADLDMVGFSLFQLFRIRSRMTAPVTGKIGTLGQVLLNDVSNEIRCRGFEVFFVVHGRVSLVEGWRLVRRPLPCNQILCHEGESKGTLVGAYFNKRRMRLEVSKRPPPISWTSL